eukprot:scaffold16681_cov152-Isochrysis_galbana.AAC.1
MAPGRPRIARAQPRDGACQIGQKLTLRVLAHAACPVHSSRTPVPPSATAPAGPKKMEKGSDASVG